MATWILFGLGSFFFVATTVFAILFHILAGRVGTDMTNGCLALIISLIGASVAMSCYYFAVA
ncbi:MAG TPA: hypothetical protein P5121_16930 [Caldilineaceae bacterium]|nr:hypothetical protein [Caldilineaceae bacterium]